MKKNSINRSLFTLKTVCIDVLLSIQGILESHIKAVQLSAGKRYLVNIWTNYSTLEVKFRWLSHSWHILDLRSSKFAQADVLLTWVQQSPVSILRFHNKISAQGKDEIGADQVNSNHGQQFGGGGDWGEVGAGGPHCLTHLYTAGMLQEFHWLFWSLELG